MREDSLPGQEEKEITAEKDAEGKTRATAAKGARVANLGEEKAKDKTAETDVGRETQKP